MCFVNILSQQKALKPYNLLKKAHLYFILLAITIFQARLMNLISSNDKELDAIVRSIEYIIIMREVVKHFVARNEVIEENYYIKV